MRDRRVVYAGLAVAALAALFLVLRPAGDDGETATTSEVAGTGAGSGPRGQTTPELEPTTTAAVRADIRLSGGRPLGGLARIEAERNQTVVVLVRSPDHRDEVHVHGYELRADVGPGDVARIMFEATETGRFEIELENSHQQIGQLTVTP